MNMTWRTDLSAIVDDSGQVLARVTATTHAGAKGESVLLDAPDCGWEGNVRRGALRFECHAHGTGGESDDFAAAATMEGLGLGRLTAWCHSAGKDRVSYALRRTGGVRRARVVSLQANPEVPIMRTRPVRAGLHIELINPGEIPLEHALFLAWVCLEADNSGRLVRA